MRQYGEKATEQPTAQLATAEDVAEKVRVVQSPHTVAPCWLESVYILQPPKKSQVSMENGKHDMSLFSWVGMEETDKRKAEKKESKGCLMSCSIVHADE